ncbi:hypothetical protein Glove_58g117 [Diversispora epigaea]|uniref:CCHC-type domain-containing protein n=1 Tax=Diversispora epigaea TaxID=1348612 RepID=A0A397JL88_9GLOM|nr:hypothetical protein Glove_58g117 [Diversispora epigaea]
MDVQLPSVFLNEYLSHTPFNNCLHITDLTNLPCYNKRICCGKPELSVLIVRTIENLEHEDLELLLRKVTSLPFEHILKKQKNTWGHVHFGASNFYSEMKDGAFTGPHNCVIRFSGATYFKSKKPVDYIPVKQSSSNKSQYALYDNNEGFVCFDDMYIADDDQTITISAENSIEQNGTEIENYLLTKFEVNIILPRILTPAISQSFSSLVIVNSLVELEKSRLVLVAIVVITKFRRNPFKQRNNGAPAIIDPREVQELRHIRAQINCLTQIRDNCQQILYDLEWLQDSYMAQQRNQTRLTVNISRRRRPLYQNQQQPVRPSLNTLLPPRFPPLSAQIRRENLSSERSTFTQTRPSTRSNTPTSSDSPSRSIIEPEDQLLINFNGSDNNNNLEPEREEPNEEDQDIEAYNNENLRQFLQQIHEIEPEPQLIAERDIATFVAKPPKFSGISNEDAQEWLQEFLVAAKNPENDHNAHTWAELRAAFIENHFRRLAKRVNLNAARTLPYFVRGLLPDIKAIIKTHEPADLATAYRKAKAYKQGKKEKYERRKKEKKLKKKQEKKEKKTTNMEFDDLQLDELSRQVRPRNRFQNRFQEQSCEQNSNVYQPPQLRGKCYNCGEMGHFTRDYHFNNISEDEYEAYEAIRNKPNTRTNSIRRSERITRQPTTILKPNQSTPTPKIVEP